METSPFNTTERIVHPDIEAATNEDTPWGEVQKLGVERVEKVKSLWQRDGQLGAAELTLEGLQQMQKIMAEASTALLLDLADPNLPNLELVMKTITDREKYNDENHRLYVGVQPGENGAQLTRADLRLRRQAIESKMPSLQ